MLLSKKSPVARALTPKRGGEHPFLLVLKEDYADLQARAANWPWSEQKEAALEDVATLRYHAASPIDVRSITLAKILSTTALAYILDPQNRQRYVARIVDHLRPFDVTEPGSILAEMRENPDKMLWRYGVPTGNAFFQGVLALDLIHDELPADQVAAIEDFLRAGPARYFRETKLAWKQGTCAAAAIFALYERDESAYMPIVYEWKRHTLAAISADGVFCGGPAYADARWSFADRENKALFGDVLAHAGVLPDWYDEPKVGKLMEWLNGYAYTPFRILWTFGDSGPDKFNGNYQPGSERAYRYSALASRYAAWLRDGLTPPGALGSYVLAGEPPAEPIPAPSRIFPDGGAWLKEASFDTRSLSGALWNLAECHDAHAHKETNSVCIAAYGEMLLRAGGYNGWATPEQGFSWDYIHDRAIAGNTVLFDYAVPSNPVEERLPSATNDHVTRAGNGITASVLNGRIDFARGDSGKAIPNGHHVRNFIFIHPADGVGGYYVTFDDLSASPGAFGQVVWHPPASTCVVSSDRQEYCWTTNEFGGRDVSLSVFLATSPAKVDLPHGVLANWGDGIIGKYLLSHYPIDSSGQTRVLTVLFPHDADHPKADFGRFQSDDGEWVGANVRQGDVTDWLFQSSGRLAKNGDITVQARAGCIRRTTEGLTKNVWLMDATHFGDADFSITCDVPVTVCRQSHVLNINCPTAVTVEVRIEGLARITAAIGNAVWPADAKGKVSVWLTPGDHTLTLERDK